MKRTLVRFVSHEIRTPLSTVNTGLDLLLKAIVDPSSMDSENYENIVKDMKTECVAAIDILNDLLSYEKIDAGLMKLHKTDFSMLPFLRDNIRPFFPQVQHSTTTALYYYILHWESGVFVIGLPQG